MYTVSKRIDVVKIQTEQLHIYVQPLYAKLPVVCYALCLVCSSSRRLLRISRSRHGAFQSHLMTSTLRATKHCIPAALLSSWCAHVSSFNSLAGGRDYGDSYARSSKAGLSRTLMYLALLYVPATMCPSTAYQLDFTFIDLWEAVPTLRERS